MSGDYSRPDPELLLRAMKKDSDKEKRGKLKVFFGMAAGVGKTYAMLDAAQRLMREGVDIVIGYIETHGRIETEQLVSGIAIIPRKKIDYRGVEIGEMDIDALLARRPSIALVDELAHTNAEGSRHAKRYQDVVELLDAGISVYTTLNVQHLESQADIVEKITGVKIRETLPDSILDMADEIELVDIPPEELLKRLAEGKVYVPEKAGLAAERFFRKGNITALREMALHYVARLVDYELHDYTQKKNIKGPWKAGERLMVAVSPSPYSEYLIRWTRRMAFNLKAPWVALYIEKQQALTPAAQELLTKNMNLARELGAEVISTADEDVISGLLRVADQKNITQIVVGKPLRKYLSDYFSGGNLVERLLKKAGDIEIHVVTQPEVSKKKREVLPRPVLVSGAKDYGISLAVIAAVTLANLALTVITGYWTIALVYLSCIIIMSLFIGRGPVFLAAAISAILWNLLFIPPLFTLRIARVEDALMFGMYFMIAIILGSLTSKLRAKESALRIREKRITDLYEFAKALGNALGVDEVVTTAVKYIEEYFNAKAAILLADEKDRLPAEPHAASSFSVSVKEHAIAEWSFKNRLPAGLFTQTLPNSDAYYLPLIAPGKVVGVLGMRPASGAGYTIEQESFLHNIASQLSMRIERENLSLASQKALLGAESERLYSVLLNSISHELRTPLTTITGASSSLLDSAVESLPETRRALLVEIGKASGRLNHLVDNLLDMSRLESGMLRLNRQPHDVGDLVSVSVRRLEDELVSHHVTTSIPDDLPLLWMDFALMEQALVNLLHNAVVHTPAGSRIAIGGRIHQGAVEIYVADNGPGLNNDEIPFLFEKFRRGARAATGGTGLGLSIAKGIVEAHGGAISALNNPEGGARFTVLLPESLMVRNADKGGAS